MSFGSDILVVYSAREQQQIANRTEEKTYGYESQKYYKGVDK
jgi:hypothetical protein